MGDPLSMQHSAGFSAPSQAASLMAGMALASLGAAAIHLSTAGEHGSLEGVAFLIIGSFQLVWAVTVMIQPHPLVFTIGALGQLAIAAVWFASRTGGLPVGPQAGHPETIGFKDSVAMILEIVVVIGSLVALRPGALARLQNRSATFGWTMLPAVVLTALTVAAVARPHAHAHEHELTEPQRALTRGHHDDPLGDTADASNRHSHTSRGSTSLPNSGRGHDHVGFTSDNAMGADEVHSDLTPSHHQSNSPSPGTGPADSGDHDQSHHSEGAPHTHAAHVNAIGGPYPYTWSWDPAEVQVELGERVKWINTTESDHHVTFYEGPSRDSLHVRTDGKASFVFAKQGSYLYRCNLSGHSEIVNGRCIGQCGSVTVTRSDPKSFEFQ